MASSVDGVDLAGSLGTIDLVANGSASGSLAGAASGSGSGGHAAHSTAHTTILFVLVAVVVGCAIQHFSSRYLKSLPYSPAMFVFGILLAVLDEYVLYTTNQLHESISRWQSIDGHLLLNVFLPPLLMADSMHLDWHVAKRSASQCFLLAFPGVVLGAFLTALYATNMLPYGWSSDLAWSFGAVLAATDPVAVVSLLKELGAPASITMIITGESLLNDGSAMVIWRFFFELYQGTRSLEAGGLIAFLIQLALGGVGLGLIYGLLSLYWLSLASHKLEHTDVIVQVVLTLVLSYCCFYTAENLVNVSGVLAVVVQGVFLSATFWPVVASRQTMEHVWHTVEWLYTTLLFTLAGLIVGQFMVDIQACDVDDAAAEARGQLCTSDLPWVLVTYVAVILIRFVTLLALLPMLRRLGYGLSMPGVLVCTWGGLRGAVGLALALSMHFDLGNSRTGKLVVLQVAGIALLTLVINAPLSPALLNLLRLTKPTETKKRLLLDMERRVHSYALDQYLDLIKRDEWKLRSQAWESKLVDAITSLSKAVDERAQLERSRASTRRSKISVQMQHLMDIAAEHAERNKEKRHLSLNHQSIAERAYASLHLPHLHPHFPHLHLHAPHLHLHMPHLHPQHWPHLPHLPHLPHPHFPHLHMPHMLHMPHLPHLPHMSHMPHLPHLPHLPHPHLPHMPHMPHPHLPHPHLPHLPHLPHSHLPHLPHLSRHSTPSQSEATAAALQGALPLPSLAAATPYNSRRSSASPRDSTLLLDLTTTAAASTATITPSPERTSNNGNVARSSFGGRLAMRRVRFRFGAGASTPSAPFTCDSDGTLTNGTCTAVGSSNSSSASTPRDGTTPRGTPRDGPSPRDTSAAAPTATPTAAPTASAAPDATNIADAPSEASGTASPDSSLSSAPPSVSKSFLHAAGAVGGRVGQVAIHVTGLDYDVAARMSEAALHPDAATAGRQNKCGGLADVLPAHVATSDVEAGLDSSGKSNTESLAEESNGLAAPRRTEHEMEAAAVRVQAVLRGKQGRIQSARAKRRVHSHRLLHVRFVFLHVLKHIYLSFVEDGIVPARSLLSHDLINSVDMAVDHLGLPLFDWAVIVQEVIRLPWYKRIWVQKDTQVLAGDSTLFTPLERKGDGSDGGETSDELKINSPGKQLKVASTLAAKVVNERAAWYNKLPAPLLSLGRLAMKAARGVTRVLRLDSLLLKLNLTQYDEHAVYVLRCFILAHEESQRELRADLSAESDVSAEVIEVIQESQLAVHEARRYLQQLTAVAGQEGIVDLVDSVRSRQLAALILSRLEAFVHRMMERGALDAQDAQHLMHELAADEERIARKGAKMFVPDDPSSGRRDSRKPSISTSSADAVNELNRIHMSGQKRLRQLQLFMKGVSAFKEGAQQTPHEGSSPKQVGVCRGLSRSNSRGNLASGSEMPNGRSPSVGRFAFMAVKHDTVAHPESQHVEELDGAMLQEASRHSRGGVRVDSLLIDHHPTSYTAGSDGHEHVSSPETPSSHAPPPPPLAVAPSFAAGGGVGMLNGSVEMLS